MILSINVLSKVEGRGKGGGGGSATSSRAMVSCGGGANESFVGC